MNKKQLKQFDKLWDEEMEIIVVKNLMPVNFSYVYKMVKRIIDKLIKQL